VPTAPPRAGCALLPGAEVPRAIPDNDPAGAISSVYVPEPGISLNDVGVRIDELRHSFNGDLRLTLLSPDGSSFVLADQDGFQSHDFFRTVLHDDAPVRIQDGSGPFTGAFRPREPLAPLRGRLSSGAWSLRAADLQPADTGTLVAWALELCTSVPLPPAPASTQISPGSGGQLSLSYLTSASVSFAGAGVQQPLAVTLGTARNRGLPARMAVLGSFFFLQATTGNGSPVEFLDPPPNVTFHYPAGALARLEPSSLRLFYWDADGSAYVEAPVSANADNRTITASLARLTEFGVVGLMKPALYVPLIVR
jgi:subtilisin-like proprotein convertase family protein